MGKRKPNFEAEKERQRKATLARRKSGRSQRRKREMEERWEEEDRRR